MADNSKRTLRWGWLLLMATMMLFPLQIAFLLDQEVDKTYWCSEEYYSTARCHEAQGAVTSSIWTLVIVSLTLLVSAGILVDRFVMPAHEATGAAH